MKKCTKCKIRKKETEFYKYYRAYKGKKYDGLRPNCKKCMNEYHNRRYYNISYGDSEYYKKWRLLHPDYWQGRSTAKAQRKWRKNNPDYFRNYFKKYPVKR